MKNRYLKRNKKNEKNKTSRFDTGPIDLENVEGEEVMEDYKFDAEPTHAEMSDKKSNSDIDGVDLKLQVQEKEQFSSPTKQYRSVFSSEQSDEFTKEENQFVVEDKELKWDKLKLIKLRDKIVEASYLDNSFFSYLKNNYNILDFYNIFKEQNNFSDILKSLITKTKPIVIETKEKSNITQNIRKLFGLIQTSKSDYGVSNLKIGWPFVVGKISEKDKYHPYDQEKDENLRAIVKSKYFYAPLLLWPTNIQTKDRKIFNMNLMRKHGQLIVEVNSHLLLAIAHNENYFEENELKNIKVDSFVKATYSEDVEVFVNNIIEKYTTFGFSFNESIKNELKKVLESFEIKQITLIEENDEKLEQNIISTFGQIEQNEVKVLPYITIGLYPIANVSLYIDYIKMLKKDGIGFVNKIDNIFYNQLELAEEYHKYFSETSLKEIVKLDFSQKKACNVALNDNLIISGAAGNGKSQTISSIIANAINNGKSVLFSTEKKEAANVIFNRLGRLRNYSLKLFESDNFAKDVTTQLKNGLERISLVYGIRDSISTTNKNVISEKLDIIYKKVNDFKSIMMTDEGQNYPEYIFKKNRLKNQLKEVIRLVGPILKNSDSSSDFWIKVNQIIDNYYEFQQISKVKENLNLNDELFTQVFNVIKYYDGNDLFFENYLIQYALAKKINEAFEKLPEEKVEEFLSNREAVKLEDYAKDPKALYWSLFKLFQSLDDYSIDILKTHDIHWYSKTANLVKQKSTELVIEFKEKYSPDEFDYQFFRDYYAMEKFASDHGDTFQVDNENYYEIIDNLITNKLGEDIKTTEFLFALRVAKVLKEDEKLARSFNKLYALIKNTDVLNSVDEVLINYSNIISLIFPLILGSPSMIAKYIVCESEVFDVCIIDEASMIPLEDAFSLLYRSKRWIVSGDIKQLPPASYQKNIEKYNKYQLMQAENSSDEKLEEVIKYNIFETPVSLLEYIGTKIQTVVLEYHYRSIKKELFEFSNIVFYKKMIHVADDQKEKESEVTTGINLKTTNGYCENGVNKKEAQEVVRIVEEIVNKPDHGTIGIITTTNEQRDYIENLLLEHPSKLVTNEFSRISDDGEDNSLFVLTCEKVQGSERDNIIISFVASKDEKDKGNILSINNTLGLLTTEVGPNFLNVLITRSRQALFIINSFETDEIIVDNNQSLMILKDYLEYAKLLTNNGHDLNDPKVQAIFKPYIKNNAVIDFSNDMKGRAISRIAPDLKEDLLQIFAFEPRLEIIDGWFEGSVKIDLIIRDRKTQRNILGILCDEFIYDVMLNGKQRDFYNRKFLETRNWNFFSLSSLQWSKVYKRQSIIDRIINILTLELSNWKEPLRVAKLTKYSVDENGNVIIVDNLIKNARNRLGIVEVDGPLYYEIDDELNEKNHFVKKQEKTKEKLKSLKSIKKDITKKSSAKPKKTTKNKKETKKRK